MPARFHFRRDFEARNAAGGEERKRRFAAYHQYLEDIRPLVSDGVYAFAKCTMHDDAVERICWTGPRELQFVTTLRVLTFSGTQSTSADWRCLRQDILAHEVHPVKSSGASEIVFIMRDVDVVVIADSVAVEWRGR